MFIILTQTIPKQKIIPKQKEELIDQSTGQPNQYSNASDLPGVIIYAMPPSSSVFDTLENPSRPTTSEWTMMGLTIPENLECTAHHKQLNHVVDVLPETSQNTKMDATLAKPEVNATTPKVNVMNSKEELKDEQTRNEQRLDNQPTHKSQPQQMLDKAKADKVKMKETYKQAKLVLKQALNHYDICKFSTDSLTLTLT